MLTTAPSHRLSTLLPRAPSLEPAVESPIHLDAGMLQPRLHPRRWRDRVRLSDDGFCDSPVGINLSQTLEMGLVAGTATLSHRALAELRLGIRQAWDLAADNLVVAARSPLGTRFYLRDATHTGLIATPTATQVRVPGAPITAWLAHPRTFTVLNSHLEDRLGPCLTYLAPLPDMLIVIPAGDRIEPGHARPVAEGLVEQAAPPGPSGGELISTVPLAYRLGFPAPWLDDAGLPRPQIS